MMDYFDLSEDEEQRVQELHSSAVIVDGLEYIPSPESAGNYLRELTQAGISAIHTSSADTYDDFHAAVRKLTKWNRWLHEQDSFIQVSTAKDILRAKKERKIAVILGFQNAKPIEDNLDLLTLFHMLKIRVIQLAYHSRNYVGGGGSERTNSGLSDFGLNVIEEMNRLGILIDLSHCNCPTTMEAIEYSKSPVAFTHANPSDIFDYQNCAPIIKFRNKSDEQIKALAEKGGVMGLLLWSSTSDYKGVRPTVQDFITMINYVVDLVGIDHVGIGTDYAPFWTSETYEEWKRRFPGLIGKYSFDEKYVKGIEDAGELINVTRGLVVEGYSDEKIRKILGGNFVRLFNSAWKEL